MIQAWRIVKARHADNAFEGEGARMFGGRWNHQGVSVVYAADSLALAALEQFIHLGREGLHIAFVYFEIVIPGGLTVSRIDARGLPKNWREQPSPTSTKQIGTDWALAQVSAVLKVPSAIVPHGNNFLLNPNHTDFAGIEIKDPVDFSFDPRMWK